MGHRIVPSSRKIPGCIEDSGLVTITKSNEMNINEFQSSINKRGVLQNNRFVVNFALPESLQERGDTRYGTKDKIIQTRCEAATFPGMNFTLMEQPRLGYGPLEAMPTNVTLDDVTLTFLVDGYGTLHALFNEWMNTIMNVQGSRGQSQLGKKYTMLGRPIGSAFEIGYKKDYRTDILITVYNQMKRTYGEGETVPERPIDGQKIMTIKLYQAFPKTLPSIDLAWVSTDELIRMSVPFTYTDFKISYHAPNTINPDPARNVTTPLVPSEQQPEQTTQDLYT